MRALWKFLKKLRRRQPKPGYVRLYWDDGRLMVIGHGWDRPRQILDRLDP